MDEVVYQGTERCRCVRAGGVLVDEGLEHERGVARPGVEVVRASRTRAGDDYT